MHTGDASQQGAAAGAGDRNRAHDHTPEDPPEHRLFAALYDPVMRAAEAKLFPPHREYLARDLSGDVLDLGAGTGAMFPYYVDAVESGRATVTAVEPDPHMRKRAVDRAEDLDLAVTVDAAGAEALPYADDSFDVVVAAMVFCTIPDTDAALDEVARVLRPGGELRFLEHVAEEGWRRWVQRAIQPLWKRVAGGCHLTRRTGEQFADHPAFETVDVERRGLGTFPVRPFVRGTLERRAAITEMAADPSVRERVRRAVEAARTKL